jgi:amidase
VLGGPVIGRANSSECDSPRKTDIRVTLNARDQDRTAGGSGGAAAVVLALRMVPGAEATDHVGSLRILAAFNSVFGFRPSRGAMFGDGADLLRPFCEGRAGGPGGKG